MTKITVFAAAFCSCLLLFFACQKDNTDTINSNDHETQSAADYSFAQTTNDDAASISSQTEDGRLSGSVTDSLSSLFFSNCVTISADSVAVPHKLTIDFGTRNCLCFDGKYRRGKILVSYTGRYRDSASTHTIAFDNYHVNDYKVEGSQTVENKGHNTDGNLTFAIQVNSTITDTAGNKLTYTSARTREWIAGESTAGLFGWNDDVYRISGTASGTTFAGISFTADITKPLVIALNCRWVEEGTLTFTPEGSLKRVIDFGSGGCDASATVTIAGFTFPIVLL